MPKLTHKAPVGIGTRVREAREDAGLNQAQLASKAGIRQGTLSELETSSQKSVAADVAFLIAKACGVRLEWLLFNRGPKREGATTADYAQILEDWAVLSTEAQAELLERLRALAAVARQMGKPVPDAHVAKHIPPLPPPSHAGRWRQEAK
jgi:transcriptional regulator with XRE-family HTH domain